MDYNVNNIVQNGHWHLNIKDKKISFMESSFSLFGLNESYVINQYYNLSDDKIKMKFRNLEEIYRLNEKVEHHESFTLIVLVKGKIVQFPSFAHLQNDVMHGTSIKIDQLDITNFVLNEGIIGNEVGIWWAEREVDKYYFGYSGATLELFGIKSVKNDKRQLFSVDFQRYVKYFEENQPEYAPLLQNMRTEFQKLVENRSKMMHVRYPIRRNDETVWIESRAAVQQFGPNGEPLLIVGLSIDITRQMESELKLKELEKRTRKLVLANNIAINLAHILVWTIDFRNNPNADIFANDIYARDLGLDIDAEGYIKFEQFLETTYPDDEGKDSMDKLLALYEETRLNNREEFLGIVVKHQHIKTGEVVFLEHHTRVEERYPDGSLKIVGGYILNITEQKRQQKQLKALNKENERLVRAQELALNSGRVMIWYYDDSEFESPFLFYANDLFFEKLGLKKHQENRFDIREYNDTVVKDEEGLKYFNEFMVQQQLILDNKSNSYYRLLMKHKNLKTGDIIYMEHNLEVNKRYPNGTIMIRGGFLSDVTEKRLYAQRIEYLVRHDSISELGNRYGFEAYVQSPEMPKSYSLIISDIDGLKFVNDAYGHLRGDELIRKIGVFLTDNFTNDSRIFRIGGDEYAIISKEIFEDELDVRIERIKSQIEEYTLITGIQFGLSIGYEVVINQNMEFHDAFISAENTMYRRKLNERNSRKSKTMETVLETLNVKTEETKEHCDRLVKYAVATLKQLGYTRGSDLADMHLLCQVHDIGKITISEDILSKPGKLTEDEYLKIKSHSEAGYKIVKNIVDSEAIADGVLYHHERIDGTGYPFGLVGDDIPLFAKVLSVVDAYDVMVTGRKYSKKKSKLEAITEIKRCTGTQFDETVADSFITVLDEL